MSRARAGVGRCVEGGEGQSVVIFKGREGQFLVIFLKRAGAEDLVRVADQHAHALFLGVDEHCHLACVEVLCLVNEHLRMHGDQGSPCPGGRRHVSHHLVSSTRTRGRKACSPVSPNSHASHHVSLNERKRTHFGIRMQVARVHYGFLRWLSAPR